MLCPVIFPFSAVQYVPNRNTVNERILNILSEEVLGRGGGACGLMWSNVCFNLTNFKIFLLEGHDRTVLV